MLAGQVASRSSTQQQGQGTVGATGHCRCRHRRRAEPRRVQMMNRVFSRRERERERAVFEVEERRQVGGVCHNKIV